MVSQNQIKQGNRNKSANGQILSEPDTQNPEEEAPPPSGKKGLLFGFIAAIILGGGGFYATYSGMIGGQQVEEDHENKEENTYAAIDLDTVFIPLDPLVVTLGNGATNRYLRFTAQLEVDAANAESVTHLVPRVMDVLNSFLRAVDSRDIEDSAAMGRLRAQMLRRVQVVTGEGQIRDLLITEFVLN